MKPKIPTAPPPRVDIKRMKLLDFILIGGILIGSAGWLLASRWDPTSAGVGPREVIVYHDGAVGDRLRLDTDMQIVLAKGNMLLEIHNHRVRISQSDCPRQHCVHQGWVKFDGESIVCVPFKTVIEIRSSARSIVDAIVY